MCGVIFLRTSWPDKRTILGVHRTAEGLLDGPIGGPADGYVLPWEMPSSDIEPPYRTITRDEALDLLKDTRYTRGLYEWRAPGLHCRARYCKLMRVEVGE